MTTPVFIAVIAAALLHATWNALVKGGADKHLSMAAVVLGHLPPALLALIFVPSPAAESFVFILAGAALHVGYQLFLMHAYKVGDLTQVYPIARGSAPLVVAGISVAFLGVELSRIEIMGVVTIGIGLISMSLVRQADGLRNVRAARLALVAGGFIAAYSLIDGYGARLAGTALGFYGWLALGNGLAFAAITAWREPGLLARIPADAGKEFLLGGSASFTAFALVIWSFTHAPIAVVAALRETSIVFALLIGVVFLKERLDLAKVVASMITLTGAIILRFAR